MKTCIKCKQSKNESDFYYLKSRGYEGTCSVCVQAQRKAKHMQDMPAWRKKWNKYYTDYRNKNKEAIWERRQASKKKNTLRWLWNSMVSRRSKQTLNISREDFLKNYTVPEVCPVLGIPISFDTDRGSKPSVDRIDSNRPYELGNIAIISQRANLIKTCGTPDEHQKISDWMRTFPFDYKPFDLQHYTTYKKKNLAWKQARVNKQNESLTERTSP